MALVKYNNNSISSVTATAGLASGGMNLIKTQTASDAASVEFKHGTSDVVLDGTYDTYLFKFIDMHPETDATDMTVNFSADTGSNYNVTKTTAFFRTQHYENGSSGVIEYITGNDLAQSTGEQYLNQDGSMGADNDQCLAGQMYLFNPSSTTFVKHFMSRTIEVNAGDRCRGRVRLPSGPQGHAVFP